MALPPRRLPGAMNAQPSASDVEGCALAKRYAHEVSRMRGNQKIHMSRSDRPDRIESPTERLKNDGFTRPKRSEHVVV